MDKVEPDGSRYLLTSPYGQNDAQYIDRNGNKLTYNSTNKQWTDTLGRTINTPPISTATTGDFTYTIPSFNGTNQQFVFRWRRLGDSGVRTDGSQPLRFKGNLTFDVPNGQLLSPALFAGVYPDRVCDIGGAGNEFNPIVLYEIQFPNGQFYRFTYNVWGEIDKVLLPSGGYERFEYGLAAPLRNPEESLLYSQTNRGVIKHWVSAKGDGTDEVLWTYAHPSSNSLTTITNPIGTKIEHKVDPPFVPNPTNPGHFGFDDAFTGFPIEERTYNSSNQMIRRMLNKWTQDETPRSGYIATRNRVSLKKWKSCLILVAMRSRKRLR
jgi:hypothetical protein